MKNITYSKIKDIINKYKYYIVLCIVICILFCFLGYTKQDVHYTVYLNNKKVELSHDVYELSNEQYIHLDDLTKIFKDHVYDDRISGKIIVTIDNNLKKIDKADENYVVKFEKSTYFNIKKIAKEIRKDTFIVNDSIYIVETNSVDGIAKENRVEIYDLISADIIGFLNKEEKVKVLTNSITENSKLVGILTDKNIYGLVLKSNIEFEHKENVEHEVQDKKLIVRAEEKIHDSTDVQAVDGICINMYRLSGINTLTKLDYNISAKDNTKIYATINNGYKASNYDSSILTEMLHSETNRENVIQKIISYTKELAGVNIDFGNFKVADKENFTQFIKELSASMHKRRKKSYSKCF